MLNCSCHHPLLESDAEYLINNPLDWGEIVKANVLFILSILNIITNLCFLLSINMITVRR